jgi:hypothetical protein
MVGRGSQRRSRGVLVIGVALMVIATSATSAVGLVAPQPVVGGPGEQYDPFVAGSLVGYSTVASKRSHAYVRNTDVGTTVRLDPAGWQGETNGFDPVSGRVLYTQWNADHRGNLYLFDLGGHVRSKLGAINTPAWEWDGRISTNFLLFLRDRTIRGVPYVEVDLYRRSNGSTRVLKRYRWSLTQDVEAGTVGDRYATWTVCTEDWSCRALLYDAVTRSIRTIPTRNNRRQYAPAVDETNGTVYFTRLGGAHWCRSVNIWRLPLGNLKASPTKIASLPDGVDTGWTSSITPNGSSGTAVDLYIERYLCSGTTGDIYRLRNVDQVPS